MFEKAELKINQGLRLRRGACYPAVFVQEIPAEEEADVLVRVTAGDFSLQDWQVLSDYVVEDDRGRLLLEEVPLRAIEELGFTSVGNNFAKAK